MQMALLLGSGLLENCERGVMSSYPLKVLSMGAGVQSTTLLYMMLRGEIEKADHIVFADTGWEPQTVYDHLAKLRVLIDQADIAFHMVSKGNIRNDFLNKDGRAASMPLHMTSDNGSAGMIRRQCTAEYKIQPILLKVRELAGLKRGERCKEVRITQMIGISYDESQRMRDPAFSWIQNDYPLVDRRITREDCIDWCSKNGYDKPPRSACIGCPFKSNEEWRLLKEMPEAWADAVEFDESLRSLPHVVSRFNSTAYLHSNRIPLREVDLRTNQEKGIFSLFDQECEGMCGV